MLRVLSWNIGCMNHDDFTSFDAARIRKIASRIKSFKADVVCLQEVETLHPQGDNVFTRLRGRLKRDRYPMWGQHKEWQNLPGHQTHGAGTAILSRLPTSGYVAHRLTRRKRARNVRYLQEVVVTPATGGAVRIFNFHGVPAMANLLVEIVTDRDDGTPFLIAGDFNMRKSSPEYQSIESGLGVNDVTDAYDTINTVVKSGRTPGPIDFILTRFGDDWESYGSYVHAVSEDPPITDHLSVHAAFRPA